jgi:hypothetical protein
MLRPLEGIGRSVGWETGTERCLLLFFHRCGGRRGAGGGFVGFVNRAKIAKWTTAGQAIKSFTAYLSLTYSRSSSYEILRQPRPPPTPPSKTKPTTTPSFHLSGTIEGEERCVQVRLINYHRRNIVEICGRVRQCAAVCGSVRQVWTAMLIVVQAAAVAASMGDGCVVAMVLGVASLTTTTYIYHPCFRSGTYYFRLHVLMLYISLLLPPLSVYLNITKQSWTKIR